MYFAAPEQFGFGQSDERTDIYGLGATINYIMTGDKPGAGIAECRFSDILKKCLMVDAKDRYQSAEELRGVLDMLNYSIVQDNRKKAETAFGKDNTISVVRTYRNIRDIIVKMYRKYQKRNYDIDTSWRRYLLPGFRRLNVVYCLIALVWYAVIVWMTITFAVTDSKTGIPVTGGELTMYKIAVFVLLFGMTLWFGNYLNIRRKLPGMKKINVLSTILTFGYAFTISFMFLAFFAIFMAIIGYL